MCTSNVEITSLQSAPQRSFHHFDPSSSHFYPALTRGSLISNQRIPVYCRSIEDIQPSIQRKRMGSSHLKQYKSAPVNTQGEGESVSEHFGHFLIRCIKFYTAETVVKEKKKKGMRGKKDGMVWRLKRELLCAEAWQKKVPHTHTSGKKTQSHCV